jgi:hypothetical protein
VRSVMDAGGAVKGVIPEAMPLRGRQFVLRHPRVEDHAVKEGP